MIYPGGPEGWDISRPGSSGAWREEDADVVNRAPGAPEIYGGHKLRCELALKRAGAEHRLPYTIIRPPSVVGPRCDDRYERLHRLAVGLPPLPLRERSYNKDAQFPGAFQVAYCDDVASAIVAAIAGGTAAQGEVFNIAQREEQTFEELV